MHDIGTLRCSVRLPQYREGVSGVLCAHVCLSARLFPCAWRTLLKAGSVEQVYESCGGRFRKEPVAWPTHRSPMRKSENTRLILAAFALVAIVLLATSAAVGQEATLGGSSA